MQTKKLATDDRVSFVMTEWCNYLCKHCMRGTRRRNHISEEVIDSVLEQIQLQGEVFLTGGEPLLYMDKVKYLLGQLEYYSYSPSRIVVITNGSIAPDKFREFIRMVKHCYFIPQVLVSNDYFHYLERKRLNDDVDFIHDRMEEYWKIMKEFDFVDYTFDTLLLEHYAMGMADGRGVAAIGRGKKIEGAYYSHRNFDLSPGAYLEGDRIVGEIEITTDGRIIPSIDASWQEMDEHYGQDHNCLNRPIRRILDPNNR